MRIEKQLLFPEGDYAFNVEAAEDTKSKKGGDMIAVRLAVTDERGNQTKVFDNLLPTNYEKFLDAVGYEYDPDIDVPASQLSGLSGRAALYIDEYQGRQKNKVKAYLPAAPEKPKPGVDEDGAPDDLPF